MRDIFDEVRRAVRAIHDAELRYLEAGFPPDPDELDEERKARFLELRELLLGPVRRAAEGRGWKSGAHMGRTTSLDSATSSLDTASLAVCRWDDRESVLRTIERHNGSGLTPFRINLDGSPGERLAALLANMEAMLQKVLKLDVDVSGRQERSDANDLAATEPGEPQPAGRKRGGALDRALAVLRKHPDWPDSRIAEEAGCSGPYLSGQKIWKASRKAIKGQGQDGVRRSGKHRGTDMDQYGETTEEPLPPAVLCAGCGDPAGRDSDGNFLVHEGEPRCPECWAELRQGS
jgi:hypothetical protein